MIDISLPKRLIGFLMDERVEKNVQTSPKIADFNLFALFTD